MLDRILGLVTRVRPGEAKSALLMALNVFLLLSAYYVIKPVREALILATGGAEVKSYSAVGQVLLLSFLVPVYGALASRVRRQVLVPWVTAGFAACLLLFYVAAQFRVPHLGIYFYLFVGIFNLMVVAQFWAMANDIYSKDQGERLFPVVGFGASVGAVAGSALTSQLVHLLGVETLLLVSCGILGSTILVTRLIERSAASLEHVAHESRAAKTAQVSEQVPAKRMRDSVPVGTPRGAFRLVWDNPYLLMIAGLMFFANWVNTNGEYILASVVERYAAELASNDPNVVPKEIIGKFYAGFFLLVNIVGLVMQLFLVSRMIQWLGVRGAILVLPCIALGSYLLLALFPVLSIVRAAKVAENSTDYSLNNTVRNALFLPLTVEEKYKAKQATDTFFVRGGDVASAGLVWMGSGLAWGPQRFAWVNLVGVATCLFLAVRIGRRYARFGEASEESLSARTG